MNTPSLQNVRNFLMATLSFLIISVLIVYLYSAYIEKPYLSYAPMPFPVTAKAIYPGGTATATATRCNTSKSAISYKSSRQLKRENSNQAAIILESVVITIEPGCSSVSTRVNVVPEETPVGFYRFSGVARPMGLMVEHEVPWNTDVFEVIAKPVVTPVAPIVNLTEHNALKVEIKP